MKESINYDLSIVSCLFLVASLKFKVHNLIRKNIYNKAFKIRNIKSLSGKEKQVLNA